MKIQMSTRKSVRVLLVLLASLSVATGADIKLRMKEEQPVNYVVDNIYSQAMLIRDTVGQLRILNQQDRGVDCFKIDNQGNLVVTRRADREKICEPNNGMLTSWAGQSISGQLPTTHRCLVTIQVMAKRQPQNLLSVEVELEDINDNKPQWTESVVRLQFKDGCKEHSKVSLPVAIDTDSGRNGLIEYSIVAPNKQKEGTSRQYLPFRLVGQGGSSGLYLEATISLDREEREQYEFTMQARDRGQPPMSGEVEVVVVVEDINDNEPLFTIAQFRFSSISEDARPGTLIGQLTATDKDSGSNGRFHFRFPNSVPTVVKKFFSLDRDGRLQVRSSLDVDRGGSGTFQFRVVVEDEAVPPYTLSSEASAVIEVTDVNDEAPRLKVTLISSSTLPGRKQLSEATAVGSIVGMLDVTDRDFGGQDTLTCRSNSVHFALTPRGRELNKYSIVTQTHFDREKAAQVWLLLRCMDLSDNAGTYNASIIVADENDNPPVFSQTIYIVSVRENSPIGTKLSQPVRAKDPDSNSIIQYSVPPPYSSNFSIDSETGVLTTRTIFDREICASYIFKVLAMDAMTGKANTGTGTVQLVIKDENDNAPQFEQDSYTFHVMETPGDSGRSLTRARRVEKVVGVVRATDRDHSLPSSPSVSLHLGGGGNSANGVFYRLNRSQESRPFRVNFHTGAISTMTSLDREKRGQYVFLVFAEDSGPAVSPPGSRSRVNGRRHTATSTVTVLVTDVNDNSPHFLLPNISHNTFKISTKDTVGFKIVHVQAIDPDERENGTVLYNISNGNSQHLFAIDESSGLLYLNLSPAAAGSHDQRRIHTLSLRACDLGRLQPRCTEFRTLRIVVSQPGWASSGNSGYEGDFGIHGNRNGDYMAPTELPSGRRNGQQQQQEAVVVCLAVLFVVLVIAAGALFCLLRCRHGHTSAAGGHHGSTTGTGSNLWVKRNPPPVGRQGNKEPTLYECSGITGSNFNGVNCQILAASTDPTRKNKESLRSLCSNSEKRSWAASQMDMKARYGYVVDHTNRPTDYQTLESLGLATSRNMQMSPTMPSFIDPCCTTNRSFQQSMLPMGQSSSFYSHNDLLSPHQQQSANLYQSMEDNDAPPSNIYNKLSDGKTFNSMARAVNSTGTDHTDQSSSNNPEPDSTQAANTSQPKYSTYMSNEASFV